MPFEADSKRSVSIATNVKKRTLNLHNRFYSVG